MTLVSEGLSNAYPVLGARQYRALPKRAVSGVFAPRSEEPDGRRLWRRIVAAAGGRSFRQGHGVAAPGLRLRGDRGNSIRRHGAPPAPVGVDPRLARRPMAGVEAVLEPDPRQPVALALEPDCGQLIRFPASPRGRGRRPPPLCLPPLGPAGNGSQPHSIAIRTDPV